MRFATICLAVALSVGSASAALAATINIQAVVDHDSELVITPTGFYWRNVVAGGAKPGYYGTSYQIPGPTYVNGIAWTPTWSTEGSRDTGVSTAFEIDLSQYTGWSFSSVYGGYFDSYPQEWGGSWHTLSETTKLNRGFISTSTYLGCQAIHIKDFDGGQNVYSLNLRTVPEPSGLFSLMALMGASGALVWRRRR